MALGREIFEARYRGEARFITKGLELDARHCELGRANLLFPYRSPAYFKGVAPAGSPGENAARGKNAARSSLSAGGMEQWQPARLRCGWNSKSRSNLLGI